MKIIRQLSDYTAVALAVITVGVLIVIQGMKSYLSILLVSPCPTNEFYCDGRAALVHSASTGMPDVVLGGLGVLVACLGIALLFVELYYEPKVFSKKLEPVLPQN